MLFGKKKEELSAISTPVFPAITMSECNGDYYEYSCEGSTLHLEDGRYVIRLDEGAMGIAELQDVTEEYGPVTIENGAELFQVLEKSLINGEEETVEQNPRIGTKESLGFYVDHEIIVPATSVEKKDEQLTITFGNNKFSHSYILKAGVCQYKHSMKLGLTKMKDKKTGTYQMIDHHIKIDFEKYSVLLVQYSGQYFEVVYKRA